MDKVLRLAFNVYLSDDFERYVKHYLSKYGQEVHDELTTEDIIEFINEHIRPAEAIGESFQVEGGDIDGWFVQGVVE